MMVAGRWLRMMGRTWVNIFGRPDEVARRESRIHPPDPESGRPPVTSKVPAAMSRAKASSQNAS